MNESRITPKGIIDDAIGMIGKMQESAFPLDVFPAQIRTIILKMHEYLNFPIDYAMRHCHRYRQHTYSEVQERLAR